MPLITPRDIIQQSAAAVEKKFSKCTVPIYGTKNDEPDFCGSSVLVSHDGEVHIITAAHVITHSKPPFYLADSSELIPLDCTFDQFANPETKDTDKDIWDLLIAKISQDTVDKFERILPIESNNIHPGGDFVSGNIFTLIGFPGSKNKFRRTRRSYESNPWIFSSNQAELPKDWIKLGASKSSHICLNFNRKRGLDEQGRSAQLLGPKGMSGCFVGVTFNSLNTLSEEPKPRLAGVMLRYKKEKQVILAVQLGPIWRKYLNSF